MSEVQLPPDEDVISICLADVVRLPYPVYESVTAMAMATALDWDVFALSEDDEDEEDDEDPPCSLCGHAYAQKHRVIPGSWGGTYHPSNVVPLCPNHHAMIHLRIKYHQDSDSLSPGEWGRLDEAMEDPGINALWVSRVKRASIQRLMDLGRYYKPDLVRARA
jgi:hypothetical protein